MITTFIYCLIEPETETVIYVGKTKTPLVRLKTWKTLSNKRFGCDIGMILLDHIDHDLEDGWQQLEIDWINFFKVQHKIQIANVMKGGNQWPSNPTIESNKTRNVTYSVSRNAKISASKKGKKLGPSKFKGQKRPEISNALRGKKQPNVSNALKGRYFPNRSIGLKAMHSEKKFIAEFLNVSFKEAGIIRLMRKQEKPNG